MRVLISNIGEGVHWHLARIMHADDGVPIGQVAWGRGALLALVDCLRRSIWQGSSPLIGSSPET